MVWDDAGTVSPEALAAQSWSDIWKPGADKVYAPLTVTTQKFAVNFFGPTSLKALHSLNIGVHAIAVVLVYLLLQTILQSHAAAFFGALFFGLHPLQVEPVSYVSALGFSLGGALGLIAVWRYMAFALARDKPSRKRASNPLNHYYVGTFFFILSVLSVPTAVIIPIFALIFDQLIPRRNSIVASRSQVWPAAAWIILGVPFAILAILSQKTGTLSTNVPFWFKPFVAGDAVSFYLSKTLVPIAIGPDFGRSPTFLLAHWWGYATWILPAMLAVVLLYWRERPRTWYGASTVLFIAGLLPFLGLFMFEGQGFSTVASRYAYLAMVGPALAIGYTICMPKQTWLAAACVAGVGLCGWVSFSSLSSWKTESALWDRAVIVNPGSPVANKALGDQARRKGDWGKAKAHYEKVLAVNPANADILFFVAEADRHSGEIGRAAELYRKTIAINPDFGPAHNGLGLVSLAAKDFETAFQEFSKSQQLMPESEEAVRNLGMLFVRKGAFAEAIPHLQRALELTGDKDKNSLAKAHALLGLAFAGTKNFDQAQIQLESSLSLSGANPEAHHVLGDIYFSRKEFSKALPHYRQVIGQLDAQQGAASAENANQRDGSTAVSGDSLASGSEVDLRHNFGVTLIDHKDYSKALEQLEKVVALKSDHADAHSALGIANFQLRRFEVATAEFEKALAINSKMADPHYYLGDIARWQGKEEIANGSYYRAIKINHDHIEAHNRLGNYFMKKKNVRAAIGHFKAALKAAPDDQKAQYNLKRAEAALDGTI